MRWRGGRQSTNVRNRGSGGIGVPIAGGGIGAVVIALLVMFLGGDPSAVVQPGPGADGGVPPGAVSPEDTEKQAFVSTVLAFTEDTWNQVFREQLGRDYPEPILNTFSGSVQSACGFAQSAMGPFYCPLDREVYLDFSFFRDLERQLNAPGDFAQAYVIAHEVGHHVQTVLGISDEVQAASQRAGKAEANALSVRQELQADCFAGLWAHHSQQRLNFLEPGDIDEALNAASAIGDDRLQKQSQGYVVPESFTHGTSAQRVRWFRRGFESGDLKACDTFAAREL